MEKVINKRIEEYTTLFKDNIKEKIVSLNICEKDKVNELLLFIYDYNRLVFQKEDFVKIKRKHKQEYCKRQQNYCKQRHVL